MTGPYFHDGSMQTLRDAVDHYNEGDGIANPWLDKDVQPLVLTESEIDDMVAFLTSLTSPQYKELGDREYARQPALSKVSRPQRDTGRTFGPKAKQPPWGLILGQDCVFRMSSIRKIGPRVQWTVAARGRPLIKNARSQAARTNAL